MRTVHGGTIRDYGPSDTSGGENVAKRADAECFVERANMRNDSFKPECAECLNPALVGDLLRMDDEYSATFRFLCHKDGPPEKGWAVIVPQMLAWIPVEKIAPGVYRCRKSLAE